MYRIKYITGILLLLTILVSACARKPEASAETSDLELITPKEASFRTAVVERTDYIVVTNTSGKIIHPVQSSLSWEYEDCRYAEILVEKGDAVQEGDVLIRVVNSGSRLELEASQLELERLQTNYAVEKEDRARDIREAEEDRDELSGSAWERADLQVKSLRTALDQYCRETDYRIETLEQEIADASERLDKTEIKAPFDGVIDKVPNAEPGAVVPTNRSLVEMHAMTRVAIESENSGGSFAYGQTVTVTVAGTDYEGTVVACANVLPIELRNNMMIIEMASAEGTEALLQQNSGYTTSVSGITTYVKDALVADRRAFELDGGQYYVQILDADGIIHRRPVVIGSSNSNGNGNVIWIVEGVSEGDTLILSNG